MNWLMGSVIYKQRQNGLSWVGAMARFEFLKLSVTLMMIIALLLIGRKRKEFFLTQGELGTPIKPHGDNSVSIHFMGNSRAHPGIMHCTPQIVLLWFG
jgi:hypothetical protein